MFYLVMLFLSSCALTPKDFQMLDPAVFYQRSLHFEVEGKSYAGFAVLQNNNYYKIKVDPHTSAELLKVNTCHREAMIEDPGRKFTYEYRPTDIEMLEVCPIDLGSFDTKKQHEWAHIEIRRNEKMMVETVCNGHTEKQFGISICQSKMGLLQQIRFPMPVKVKSNCLLPETSDHETFTYKSPKGFCQAIFYESSEVYHRHIVMGYEDIIYGDL